MKSSVAGFQPASVYVTMHPGALPQALLFQPFRLFYYLKNRSSLYMKNHSYCVKKTIKFNNIVNTSIFKRSLILRLQIMIIEKK